MPTATDKKLTFKQRFLIFISDLLLSMIFRLNGEVVTGLEHIEAALASDRPVYIALWHSRLLYGAWYLRRYRPYVLSSKSRDGDLMAGVLRRWNFRPIRGSSHRGGSGALRHIVRALGDAQTVLGITMDGPTGPPNIAKVGSVAAGIRHNAIFVPFSATSTRKRVLQSWDSQHFPKPFGKLIIKFGEPISFDANMDADLAAQQLGEVTIRLEQETDGIAANLG